MQSMIVVTLFGKIKAQEAIKTVHGYVGVKLEQEF